MDAWLTVRQLRCDFDGSASYSSDVGLMAGVMQLRCGVVVMRRTTSMWSFCQLVGYCRSVRCAHSVRRPRASSLRWTTRRLEHLAAPPPRKNLRFSCGGLASISPLQAESDLDNSTSRSLRSHRWADIWDKQGVVGSTDPYLNRPVLWIR